MAKRTSASAPSPSTVPEQKPAPKLEHIPMPEHHRTFSHIMFALFLFASTLAAWFTYMAIRTIAGNPNFYGVLGILLLLWGFLFLEFGYRIHVR